MAGFAPEPGGEGRMADESANDGGEYGDETKADGT